MSDNNKQITSILEVKNSQGLHARPASMLIEIVSSFESEVLIDKDGETISGNSLMGLLMLSAGKGSKLTFSIEGEDAHDLLIAIEDLFERNFDEE